jgi:hypothetical protein
MRNRRCQLLLVLLCLVTVSVGALRRGLSVGRAQSQGLVRRVNVPYTAVAKDERLGVPAPLGAHAIFWFGKVTPTENYADVRMIFNDEALFITLNIFDRLLWYDETPTPSDLTSWDAVSLFLYTAQDAPAVLTPSSYRFDAQLNWWEPRAEYQAAYRGGGSSWNGADISFATTTSWRGEGINGPVARGWALTYEIPHQSLGASSPPNRGTVWRMGLAMHDRDDVRGTITSDQSWPEGATAFNPSSWGELHFGDITFLPPLTAARGEAIIRHRLNNAVVPDAPVGGHSVCGEPFDPDFFDGWGDAVHRAVYVEAFTAPGDQINVQNQADLADWPCFSKYYVTFPLAAIPRGKRIVSATLTMHQFGNSLPSDALPSEIQVLTVAEEWSEATLTWNNAPLVVENISRSRVDPLREPVAWPGIPRRWDVSKAVADAHALSQRVRLVLYSADAAYHSGKYFVSSETGDWNEVARPTLTVVYGDAIDVQSRMYLPATWLQR